MGVGVGSGSDLGGDCAGGGGRGDDTGGDGDGSCGADGWI